MLQTDLIKLNIFIFVSSYLNGEYELKYLGLYFESKIFEV